MAHLWLIGMMGTGKTTVGVIAAELTGRPFVDIDTLIMETSGRTIPELFEEGEDVFRRWESRIIAETAKGPPSVIATGGGSILATVNVETMRASGTTVLLTAPIDVITDRIGTAPFRPLATDPDALTAISDLRMATYRESSDHVVDTENKEPTEIAEEVVACAGI